LNLFHCENTLLPVLSTEYFQHTSKSREETDISFVQMDLHAKEGSVSYFSRDEEHTPKDMSLTPTPARHVLVNEFLEGEFFRFCMSVSDVQQRGLVLTHRYFQLLQGC